MSTQLGFRVGAGALGLAASVLITVVFGLGVQGTVATSVAAIAGLSVLTGSGATHAVAYSAARDPLGARATAASAAALALVISVFVGTSVAVIGAHGPSIPVLWWPVAAALPMAQLGEIGLGLQQGLGRPRAYTTTYAARPVALFTLALIAAVAQPTGDAVPLWSGLLLLGPFAAQALSAVLGWRTLPGHGEGQPIGRIIGYSARMYPSVIAQFAGSRLDLLFVGGMLGATTAGIYSLALSAVDAVGRLGQTAASLQFSTFARWEEPAASQLALRSALATGGASGAMIAGFALAMSIAAGSVELQTLAELLSLLIAAGAAVSAWTVLAVYLASRNRLFVAARINAVLIASSLGLYVVLIPALGVAGGAIGTSVGLAAAAGLGIWEVARARVPLPPG